LLSSDASAAAVSELFARRRVVELAALFEALKTTSRTSVFRRLSPLGYLTSYSHTGRYYTLKSIPTFDPEGLWQHQGVLFSVHGSLKETAWHMVETSRAGRTHEELRDRLRVRVHNALLDLLEEKRLQREMLGEVFLYLSASRSRAKTQRRQRLEETRSALEVPPYLVVEILIEVIHGARAVPEPNLIASRLAARGVRAPPQVVEAVYERHGLGKKTTVSPPTRSRR